MVANYILEEVSDEYKRILSLTTSSIKMHANSYYKAASFVDATDIEHIKSALISYNNADEKVNEFKNAIIEDLTAFQNDIKKNYVQRINELVQEKQLCEKQIKVLEFAKNKLIAERLSKIAWPYDEKTKEFDAQVAKLQIKIQNIAQRIEEAQSLKPAADEKDILLYQMHLKETFAQ